MEDRIFELKMNGYCCSQIIMQMGLDHMGKENPDLIAAMRGLCNGLQEGKVCGTLSAAACLLFLADPERAATRLNLELLEWFYDAFGAIDCEELLEGDPMNKVAKCPMIVESTYKKVVELLEWEDE